MRQIRTKFATRDLSPVRLYYPDKTYIPRTFKPVVFNLGYEYPRKYVVTSYGTA
jgi:hypothetical protein